MRTQPGIRTASKKLRLGTLLCLLSLPWLSACEIDDPCDPGYYRDRGFCIPLSTGGSDDTATGGTDTATGGDDSATGGDDSATGGADSATGGDDSATGGAST